MTTRENIEKMALKVGAHDGSPCDECGEVNPLWQFGTEELWQFGWHIAAAEAEACTEIAKNLGGDVIAYAIQARWGRPGIKWEIEP